MAHGGIGLEAYEVLVEAVIAPVGQYRRDASALLVKHIQVKFHPLAQPWQGVCLGQLMLQHRILDIHIQVAHMIALAGMHLVAQAQAVASHTLITRHAGIQITHTAHGQFHIDAGAQAQGGVVDDRCLAQATQEAVEALGAVGTRETIYRERHRNGGKPAAVGMLAHETLQGLRVERTAVGRYAHPLEQVGAFGYKAVHAARGGHRGHHSARKHSIKPTQGFHFCKGSARRA